MRHPLAIALLLLALGCDRAAEIAPVGAERGALTETHEGDYALSWVVTPEGGARVGVTKDGRPVAPTRGDLRVKALGDAENVKHELTLDEGILTADVGPLAEVTVVRYRVEVDGRTLRGSLHLPAGGTAELVGAAERHDAADLAEKGPAGGLLQRVGDDVVEVVVPASGELRVYVRDDDLRPVALEDRSVRLILDDEVVTLTPARAYFVGKRRRSRAPPTKITVVVHHGGMTRVARRVRDPRPRAPTRLRRRHGQLRRTIGAPRR